VAITIFISLVAQALLVQEDGHKLFIINAIISGTQTFKFELKAKKCIDIENFRVVVLQDVDKVVDLNETRTFFVKSLEFLD
jgi:hypothetical protein